MSEPLGYLKPLGYAECRKCGAQTTDLPVSGNCIVCHIPMRTHGFFPATPEETVDAAMKSPELVLEEIERRWRINVTNYPIERALFKMITPKDLKADGVAK